MKGEPGEPGIPGQTGFDGNDGEKGEPGNPGGSHSMNVFCRLLLVCEYTTFIKRCSGHLANSPISYTDLSFVDKQWWLDKHERFDSGTME